MTVDGCAQKHYLFYIHVKNHGYNFLVDNGAEISILPPDPWQKLVPGSYSLQAVNGTKIDTFREKPLMVNLRID